MGMEFKAVLMVGLSVEELGVSEDDFWNDIEPQGFIHTHNLGMMLVGKIVLLV